MKQCAEVKPLLYLYAELTAAEKDVVNTHIAECEACSVMFESIQKDQVWIQHAAQIEVTPLHAGRLTSNIMTAIAKQHNQFAIWRSKAFFRYAMMAVSFALIIFFGAEQLLPAERVYQKRLEARTVTLNSSSFMKVVADQRERKKTNNPSLYACAKSGACENGIIKNFKLKKSS